MRIAFVNATSRWGGVKSWMLNFGAALVSRGHDVRLYGRQPEFVAAARARLGHGVRMDFGMDLNPATIRRFRNEFMAHGTEVVILNVGKDLATAGVAAKLLGIPVVQRIGLPDDIPYRFKTRLLHQWIRPLFLSPCRYIAEGFARSLPYLDGFRHEVVLNAKVPTTHELEVHTPRQLVMTQQLFPDKEHATVLRALSLLLPEIQKDRCTDFHLHVIGTGAEEEALKALTVQLHLSARVTWHGFSTTVPEHLAAADIFVLASTVEGLPNTLLEAMASGLLPVTRDVGGVREVLPEILAPFCLPFTADPANFAAILQQALCLPDPELLALRHAAREASGGTDERVAEVETLLAGLRA